MASKDKKIVIPVVVEVAEACTLGVLRGRRDAGRDPFVDEAERTGFFELVDEQAVGRSGTVGDVDIEVAVPVVIDERGAGEAS